jgi:polynucleotide 5'-kinase involved in rRNA processing
MAPRPPAASDARPPEPTTLAPGAHVLTGPADFSFEGEASALGAPLKPGRRRVPPGEKVALEAKSPLKLTVHSGGAPRPAAPGHLPAEWDRLAQTLAASGEGVCVVTGAPGAGRTSFSYRLANRLFAAGRRAAVVGADPSRPASGPLGCVTLTVLNDPVPLPWETAPQGLESLGTLAPPPDAPEWAAAVARLTRVAREQKGAAWVVVDAPAVVSDAKGAPLREALSKAFPRAVWVALVKKGAPAPSGSAGTSSVPVSSEAEATPPAVLAARREWSSRAYFASVRFLLLPFHHVMTVGAEFLSGKEVKPAPAPAVFAERLSSSASAWVRNPPTAEEASALRRACEVDDLRLRVCGVEAGAQVALQDEGGTVLALGRVQKFDFDGRYIEIWTPLDIGKESRVKVVRFGRLRLGLREGDPAFSESEGL